MKWSLIVLSMLGLFGCATIDHRTTGSATMNTEWSIAPLLNVLEERNIPEDADAKKQYLAQRMASNGGVWLVNSWIAGSVTPSLSMITEYWCPPNSWPDQSKCKVNQKFAAADGGWFKPMATAAILGGAYVGGQAVRRPDNTNVQQNSSGGGASQYQGQGQGQYQGQYQKTIRSTPKHMQSPGWGVK